jgi:Spy/CpxP family protein refolding chaperone
MKKRIGLLVGTFVGVMLLSAGPLSAQQPQPEAGPKPQGPPHPAHQSMDPLSDVLFPADLVMQHQRELGLTDEQKTFIRAEVQKTTTRFNELHWQLQDAMEALHDTMMNDSTTEQQALAQLDKVLDAEREIKRLHIGMAMRIKSNLTPEQRAKVFDALRHMMGPGQGGPGHGPAGNKSEPPPTPEPDDEDY